MLPNTKPIKPSDLLRRIFAVQRLIKAGALVALPLGADGLETFPPADRPQDQRQPLNPAESWRRLVATYVGFQNSEAARLAKLN